MLRLLRCQVLLLSSALGVVIRRQQSSVGSSGQGGCFQAACRHQGEAEAAPHRASACNGAHGNGPSVDAVQQPRETTGGTHSSDGPQ